MSPTKSDFFRRLDRPLIWRSWQAALLSVLFLSCATLTAHAQFTRFQTYADEQGLGNLTVTTLAQDKDGYILAGTQGGLYRYDGSGFRQDTTGLPMDWIKQIAIDPAGRVWVATNQNGLFVGDGSRFGKVNTGKTSITITSPHLFAAAGDGVVLDVGGTLLHAPEGQRDGEHFTRLFDPATLAAIPALGHARFVVSDAAGGLLIGCGDALCRATSGHVAMFSTADGLPADRWQTALRTADGTLWVRSLSRLAWRRPGQSAFTAIGVPGQHSSYFAGQPHDLQLLTDHDDGVLTQGDEELLDWTGSTWRVYEPHAGGLPTAAITSMLWDREGSLWLGSQGYGAFRSAGLGIWEHWTKEDGLPSSTIWGTTRLPGGRFWVATDAGSVALGGGVDGVGGESFAAAASRAGRLWLAPTGGPLIRTDGTNRASVRLPSIGNVYAAVVDHENRLWLTTGTSLFVVPDADAAASDLHIQAALSGKWCHVVVDPAAIDWAICRDGVFRRNPDGTFEQAISPALLQGRPLDASFAAHDELWIGTQTAGVLRFHVAGRHVEPLPPLDRSTIGSESVMFIHHDRRGWMWVGTSHGIDRFDGRSWRRFDSSEGPISNDTDEYSVFEDADGSLWFGTSHGLSHLIAPDHLPSPLPLHPLVTSLSLGRRTLSLAPSVHIAWSREPLVVRFNDLDYARGRGLIFRYRLQGVDLGWNDTPAHEVRYAELPPGKLRFELMVVDTLHGTVSAPVGFTIRIDPPWWRRWWFYGLCVLTGTGVIVLVWRFRMRLLLHRQRRLEDEQQRLEEVVSVRTAEIERAKDQLQHQALELQHQAVELTRQSVDLQRLALTDMLTGLPNRHAIMSGLEAAIAEAKSSGPSLAVMICDIDHFKAVNDTFGHLAGDAVLAIFGARLGAAIDPPEAAGRYGGEEFLVILRGKPTSISDRVAAIQVAIVGSAYELDGTDRTVTCSGGLAVLREDDTLFSLLGRADAALYRAKANGRNRFEDERDNAASCEVDQPEDPARILRRDLRAALDRGEFELHYQPIFDVGRDRITSYEALLRWHSPSRGNVSPAQFIPFAEQNGLMTEIDAWVIRTACREAAAWPDDIRVSVNLSSSHFHQPDLVQNIAAALAEAKLPSRRLELEVTETAMIVDIEAAALVLDQLRTLGISIALDDFGTGYSSLSFVSTLPFDRIKIDRSFVRNLGIKPEAAAIIGSVIYLCQGMAATVTAEGVETAEQIELLRAIGCREMQGFKIGRPMPANRIRAGSQTAATTLRLAAVDG